MLAPTLGDPEDLHSDNSKKKLSEERMSEDLYSNLSDAAKLAVLINILKGQGQYQKAEQLRNALAQIQNRQATAEPMDSYRGSSEAETLRNIKNEVLNRIRNNDELTRLVYEELDVAYVANFDYGLLKNTRKIRTAIRNLSQRFAE